MNAAHLHLAVNHIPVIGTFFGALLIAYAIYKKSEDFQRFGLAVLVGVALSGGAAFLTGEPAEEVASQQPGVTENVIEPHEKAATTSLIVVGLAGVLSAAGLWKYRRPKPIPAWLPAVTFLLTLIGAGLMAWTANLGGQIRHTEIRSTST